MNSPIRAHYSALISLTFLKLLLRDRVIGILLNGHAVVMRCIGVVFKLMMKKKPEITMRVLNLSQ